MRIQVNGKHIDVGESLTSHVEAHLVESVSKYSERPVEAIVTFSKDRHEFVADATVHLSTGLTTKAKGRATDIYEAFEGCLERMEKQLRRYKRRLKDHHKERTNPIEAFAAQYHIIDRPAEEDEPESLKPVIVAEMPTEVKTLSVGEAVMQLELDGANVLVFRNENHGTINVVFQRDDGNVGWIDPHNIA